MSRSGDLMISRRELTLGSAALGAALVAPIGRLAATGAPSLQAGGFLSVTAHGVELALPKTEMGQGVLTALSMLAAEELGVTPAQVKVTIPDGDAARFAPIDQGTGGSTTIRTLFRPVRQAAANIREALVRAAAQQWAVTAQGCDLVDGFVVERATRRRLPIGALLTAAGAAPLPVDAALRPRGAFKVIGRPTKRLDSLAQVTGATVFGIDVRVPGMKIAYVAQCPVFGGTLGDVNEKAALAVPGVVQLVKGKDVVFVVADSYWNAWLGYAAADPRWTLPDRPAEQSRIMAELEAAVGEPGYEVKRSGDLAAARSNMARSFSATYRQPFLAHAPMEPASCVAHVTAAGCEIWSGSQVPSRARADAARALGLPVERVTFHNFQMGGGFGRRLETDMVVRAVELGRQTPYPVKLMWSREEDMKHDMYRPAYVDTVWAAIDANGAPTAVEHKIAGSSILTRLRGGEFSVAQAEGDAVEGAVTTPYALGAHRVTFQPAESLVPTSWWRGVGGLRSAFVVESFIDELAHAAQKDPLAYRLSLVTDARVRTALERVGREAAWGSPLAEGRGRGVAVLNLWDTVMAVVVEAAISDGAISVIKVTAVVDCGLPINPLGISAQVEGGVIFGLSAALYGGITIGGGQVDQSNFNTYRVMRLAETPPIATYIIDSDREPGGLGEPPCAVVAPALANAIFAANGRRLRSLPLTLD